MLERIWEALRRRKEACAEAERLVWQHGSRAAEAALDAALTPGLPGADRAHLRHVAHLAARCHADLEAMDAATRYFELARIEDRVRGRV